MRPLAGTAHRLALAAGAILIVCAAPVRAAIVHVQVVDDAGNPLPERLVRLVVDDGLGDAGTSLPADGGGSVTFGDLLPGHYRVTLDPAETDFVRPEYTDPPTVVSVVIRGPGDIVETRLALERGRRAQFGFVVDGSRQRHWASVVAVNLDTRRRVRERIEQDEDLVLTLVPGRWNVILEPPPGLLLSELQVDGQPLGGHQANVDLREALATTRIEWRFAAPARITGRVRFDDPAAMPARIDVRASLLRPGAWFDDARRRGGSAYTSVTARVDPGTGRFVLELPDGRWQLEALGASGDGGRLMQRIDLAHGEDKQIDFELEVAALRDGRSPLQHAGPPGAPPLGRDGTMSNSLDTDPTTTDQPALTLRLYCDDGEPVPRLADVRVFGPDDEPTSTATTVVIPDANPDPDPDATPAILALEDVALVGDMRDRLVAGPLPATHAERLVLAVRPAGFDHWLRVPVEHATSGLTDVGAVAVNCSPRLRVTIDVASGRSVPDLRLISARPDRASRPDRDDHDNRGHSFDLEGSVRTPGGDSREIEQYRLEPAAGELIVRDLPEGEADLRLRLGHSFFLPDFWIELPVDGTLVAGHTLDVEAVVYDVGGAIAVRARDAVAARAVTADGREWRDVFRGGRTVFRNLPADDYRLEVCSDAACRSLSYTWTDVAVAPLQVVELSVPTEPSKPGKPGKR